MRVKKPPRTAKAAYHHGNLRAALIEQARGLLEEHGDAAVTLREVARRAGVSHTAAYHHFESREGLLLAVATQAFVDFAAALTAAAGAPDERLPALGRAYVGFAVARPRLFRFMFSSAVTAHRAGQLAEKADAAFAILVNAVRAAPRDPAAPPAANDAPGSPGAADPNASQRAALGAWAVAHGLAMLLIDDQLAHLGFAAQAWEQAVRLLLYAPAEAVSGAGTGPGDRSS